MWKSVLILFVLIGLCWCDMSNYGIKNHHHHDMYYGGGLLYYLTFLAIKVKIAFVIGAIIVMILFFGKLWALISYTKYMMGDTKSKQAEPEKIYIQAPSHHDHEHSPYHSKSPGPEYLDESMNSHSYVRPNRSPPTKTYSTLSKPYPTLSYHQRGFQDSVLDDLNRVAKFMEKLDVTEIAFNSMHLKDVECRKRFVCEVDVKRRSNSLISFGYSWFAKTGLEKYRTEKTPSSVHECRSLYPNCRKMAKSRR